MKHCTVRITFKEDTGRESRILFGNSYKHWSQQAEEFVYRYYGIPRNGWRYQDVKGRVLRVERSDAPWIQSGLKWCHEAIMQQEYDEEFERSVKAGKPITPRRYWDLTFDPWPYGKSRLIKLLRRW